MNDDSDKPKFPIPVPVPVLEEKDSYLLKLNHYLALTLSIPERAARAMGAIIGGSTLLLSKTLIPNAIKSSSSYRFTIGMFQSFLIKNVAGLDHIETDAELKDQFVNRKLLGTSLEAAGLLTMHLSPVWIFAIASDAAKGGQVFLQRLVRHLKENHVIEQDSHPESLEQILISIHELGSHGATAVDTPPLDMDEARELADQLRSATSRLTVNSSRLLPSFESIWQQISLVANKENLSTEQVMGMLSVSAASLLETGVGTADAVGKTGFYILDEMLLNDYNSTLGEILEQGSLNYMQANMQPFLENAQSHFNMGQETRFQRWFKNGTLNFFQQLFSKS
jgi:hypothetical protein